MTNWIRSETFELFEVPSRILSVGSQALTVDIIGRVLSMDQFPDLYFFQSLDGQLIHIHDNEGLVQLIVFIDGTEIDVNELHSCQYGVSYESFLNKFLFNIHIKDKPDRDPLVLPFVFDIKNLIDRYHITAICEQRNLPVFFLRTDYEMLTAIGRFDLVIPDETRHELRGVVLREIEDIGRDGLQHLPSREEVPESLEITPSFDIEDTSTFDRYRIRIQTGIKIFYNVEDDSTEVIGIDSGNILISKIRFFNIPMCIYCEGVPLYPSKYESAQGKVVYYNVTSPRSKIKVSSELGISTKSVTAIVTPDDLVKYLNPDRTREPDQYTVMGMSASKHISSYIDNGSVRVEEDRKVLWHWCHLIAFSMLPTEKAQNPANLICGTDAFNGQMTSIEFAVIKFIQTYKRPLRIDVSCDILNNSHIGIRLEYRVYDDYSNESYIENYNPLQTNYGNIIETDVVFSKLVKKFTE